MNPRRDVACAVCGLLACAHLSVIWTIEAAHPHDREPRPTIEATALPPEPDHGHRDFDRSARIQGTEMTVSGTSSSAWVPSVSQQANWVPAWPRDSWHPAYYFRPSQIAPLLPPMSTGTITSASS